MSNQDDANDHQDLSDYLLVDARTLVATVTFNRRTYPAAPPLRALLWE